MLEALIFDVDGTLSETEETHRAAFNAVFGEVGLPWVWDQALYRRLLDVTGGKERLRHYLSDFDVPWPETVPRETGAFTDWIASTHARKTVLYNAMVDGGAAGLRPGIEALIRHARNTGTRLAIATTTSLPNVESLIRATLGSDGLGFFEAIAAGDMVTNKKPAPDVYLLALERLGIKPDHCLALEDSVNGLVSARGAGLPVLVTTSVYTSHQTFPEALATLPDLNTLAGPAARTPVAGAAILTALRNLHAGQSPG